MRIFKTASVCLAVAAVSVAAVVPACGLLSANASSTACGSACTSLLVESDGTTDALTVTSLSAGTVAMDAVSTTSTDQDFTLLAQGGVTGAADAGVVSAKLGWIYGGLGTLVEYEYAPGGIPSGMCLAGGVSDVTVYVPNGTSDLATTAYVPNLSVTLARCGLTAQTLWMPDPFTQATNSNGYVDLINAGYEAEPDYDDLPPGSPPATSPTNTMVSPFAEGAVLAVSGGKVVLAELSEIGGVVSTGQMWTGSSGSLGSQARQALEKKSAAALRAAGKS